MSQADLFGARTAPPPEPERARFDVDCTPSPVALQGVEAVTRGWLRPVCCEPGKEHEGDAPRVLDLCAGSGSWSRAVRLLFPRAHITALEVRPEERSSLERWCDVVAIGDVAEILTEQPAIGPFDLIVGNPPFSLVDARKPKRKARSDLRGGMIPEGPGKSRLRAFEVLVVAARSLLTPRGREALYVPAAWWQRGADVAALAQQHQPFRQFNVPLPVSHRGAGQQAASDAYAIYVWAHPSVPTCNGWHTLDLPILSAADRRWREVPGTER